MTIKKYAPIFLFFLSLSAVAQSKLEGSVTSQTNEPVAFANVILYSAQDSVSVYKGAVSDENGNFIFSNIIDSTYLLKISYVGFEEYLKQISISGDTKLQTIRLKESSAALDEVTVNARKPKVRKEIDRLVFQVENSTLSSGNTFEILKRTPGVIVVQDQLLVKNRPATVYINDRKVYLTAQELQQLLEGFSGENVKSVEVITTPPAKYDAEGGAILNIVTSKNISVGYKGSLNASNTIAIKPKYTVGTSQYYKNDWLNVFGSYNFNARNDYKKDENRVVYFEPDGSVDSRWLTDFERNTESYTHNINTILDFTLSETSSLSLSANYQLKPKGDSDITGLTEIMNPQGQLDSLYTTDSQLNNDQRNLLLGANYTTEIGENGASFSAVTNYIKYDDDQTQDLSTDYFLPDGSLIREDSFFTIGRQNSEIYTGQLDLETPWGSSMFQTGIKYSGVDSQSGQLFFDTNTGTRQFNSNFSDTYDYNEDIYAGYLSWSKDWEKWGIQAGLRGEYTDIEGVSATLGAVNTQEYFELFPTIYLMHQASEDHYFGLDYSRRIIRPRFQSLNSFRYFLNENNVKVGNPNLLPGIANKINFNYTYKGILSFDLYWDRIDDATVVLPFQDNEARILRSVNDNLDFEQQFSLDISYYDYLNDWWYVSAYASLFYMQADFFARESNNQIVTNDTFSTFFQGYNQFTLSEDRSFIGELSIYYAPDFVVGSYDFEEQQLGVSFGVRKNFFDNRLTATINVEDIFNTMNIPLASRYLNQNNSYFAMPESRSIRFGLKYNFGNFKLKDNSRPVDAEESERLKEKTVL